MFYKKSTKADEIRKGRVDRRLDNEGGVDALTRADMPIQAPENKKQPFT